MIHDNLRGLPFVLGQLVLHRYDAGICNQDVKPLDFFLEFVHESFDGIKTAEVDQPKLSPVESSAVFEVYVKNISQYPSK